MFNDSNFIQIFDLKQIKNHLLKTTQVPTCLFLTFYYIYYFYYTMLRPSSMMVSSVLFKEGYQ